MVQVHHVWKWTRSLVVADYVGLRVFSRPKAAGLNFEHPDLKGLVGATARDCLPCLFLHHTSSHMSPAGIGNVGICQRQELLFKVLGLLAGQDAHVDGMLVCVLLNVLRA